MRNPALKKTGKSRERRIAATSTKKPLKGDPSPEDAEPKTALQTKKQSDPVEYIDVFRSIEAFLRSLKTFNVTDTSGLRESEKIKVLELIYNNFTAPVDSSSVNSTMIIFGQPGLGKTLLVHEIHAGLQKLKFDFVLRSLNRKDPTPSRNLVCIYMNAMNFTNCFDFIDEFLSAVDGQLSFFKKGERKKANSVVKIEVFLNKLPSLLETNRFLLLIDELESLSQNDKANFHHLMQILNLRRPGFVNICISNTLSLFSSLNGNSLYLNFEYLIFKPYSEDALAALLNTRFTCEKTPISIEELLPLPALTFIVKKAFKNTSSDVRFILTVAQNIIENKQAKLAEMQRQARVLNRSDLPISFPEILMVFDEKLCGDWGNIVQKLNFQTQVLLLAVWQNVDPVNQTIKLAS